LPGLKFGFNGGYENATADSGQSAIDIMDRTAGHPGWMVIKPFITQTSNCIVPTDTVNEVMAYPYSSLAYVCVDAYTYHIDPGTQGPYVANPATNVFGYPTPGYAGFNPD